MPLKVGVDLVTTARVKPLIDNQLAGFLQQFTANEQLEAAHCHDELLYFTERFAAKEAVLKSLNILIKREFFVEIETLNNVFGKPVPHISGSVKEIFTGKKLQQLDLSLSYENGFVIAVAVVN
jgi:phosphopantetheine--protein transferase-like protein